MDLNIIATNKPAIAPSAGVRGIDRWIPPPLGTTKINPDGVVSKSIKKGDVGVICRDDHGVFRGASAVVYEGVTDPATLEAYACREALVIAEDLMLSKLKVASDCLRLISDLQAPIQFGSYCMVLREIQDRRSKVQASELATNSAHAIRSLIAM